MLQEQVISDESIHVVPDGRIEVREATVILRDGARDETYPPKYRRYTLAPGDDIATCAPRIAAVASAVWTADVVAAWRSAAADSAQS